jgi:hypothetical protein
MFTAMMPTILTCKWYLFSFIDKSPEWQDVKVGDSSLL